MITRRAAIGSLALFACTSGLRSTHVRDFVVTGDIQSMIDTCAQAGGGRVVVPPGEHATGPLRLRSHVELHVASGATIHFSNDPSRYPLVLTRWD